MATLPTLTPVSDSGSLAALWGTPLNDSVAYTRTGGTWSQSSAPAIAQWPNFINQTVPTSEADGQTGLVLNTNNGASAFSFAHVGTPSDFSSMATVTVRVSIAYPSTFSDDDFMLGIAIRRTSDGLALASISNADNQFQHIIGYSGASWQSSSSATPTADGTATRYAPLTTSNPVPPVYNHVMTFSYVNTTATKTDWDNSRICIYQGMARNMGGDGGQIVLVDLQIEGTYVQSSPPATINPTGSSSTSTSDTAQLTTSWPTVTVNPVDSTSASTSDTAQLTATWLPMTVNPVGSTSTSSSDQAQLTVADPPMTVNPVGSTSTSSSDVAQLTTSWPPMTVNPVGSTSLSSSDTAQLTVTGGAPPMTVNPVGSSSLSSADSAALTSPGTPLAVSDLAGTPGSSGEVDLTWSEPVGVQ